MASKLRQASAHSVLSAPLAHCCDEDRQPCSAPQQSSAGPNEALHSWGVSFPVPVDHQLPAAAAATVAAEATDPAVIQQRQHPLACWWVLLLQLHEYWLYMPVPKAQPWQLRGRRTTLEAKLHHRWKDILSFTSQDITLSSLEKQQDRSCSHCIQVKITHVSVQYQSRK